MAFVILVFCWFCVVTAARVPEPRNTNRTRSLLRASLSSSSSSIASNTTLNATTKLSSGKKNRRLRGEPTLKDNKNPTLPLQEQKNEAAFTPHRQLQVDPSGPTLTVLVLLLQWSNHPTRNTAVLRDDYEQLFNGGTGRDPDLYPGGTVGNYFQTMSYGKFNMQFIVIDWIMTEAYSEQSFTQDGSQGRTEALQQAFTPLLQYLDDDYFDFQQLDGNYDKVLDLTLILHSGYDGVLGKDDCETGMSAQQRIASHARSGVTFNPATSWLSAGGYRLGPYAVVPAFRGTCETKIGRIGPIIHETIHTFGLPELYDVEGYAPTQNTGANLGGIDRFGVMANAAGNSNGDFAWPGHISAWTRFQLGWTTPIEITQDGTYTLRPIELYPDLYILRKGFANAKEYLLLENRQPIVNDYDEKFFAPGGIVIYHVDENIWDVFPYEPGPKGQYPRGGPFLGPSWPKNGKHYPVAILQADGLYELEQALNGGDAKDLWNVPTQKLSPQGTQDGNKYPNTDSYAFGKIKSTGITLQNFQTITNTNTEEVEGRRRLSSSSTSMTFQVCGLDSADCPEIVTDDSDDPSKLTTPPTRAPTNAPTQAPIAKVLTLAPTVAPTQIDATVVPSSNTNNSNDDTNDDSYIPTSRPTLATNTNDDDNGSPIPTMILSPRVTPPPTFYKPSTVVLEDLILGPQPQIGKDNNNDPGNMNVAKQPTPAQLGM